MFSLSYSFMHMYSSLIQSCTLCKQPGIQQFLLPFVVFFFLPAQTFSFSFSFIQPHVTLHSFFPKFPSFLSLSLSNLHSQCCLFTLLGWPIFHLSLFLFHFFFIVTCESSQKIKFCTCFLSFCCVFWP